MGSQIRDYMTFARHRSGIHPVFEDIVGNQSQIMSQGNRGDKHISISSRSPFFFQLRRQGCRPVHDRIVQSENIMLCDSGSEASLFFHELLFSQSLQDFRHSQRGDTEPSEISLILTLSVVSGNSRSAVMFPACSGPGKSVSS